MKKMIVLGCPGSGKSTFSCKLQKLTGKPIFYLDAIWHKPDRTHISREEFDIKLSEILKGDEWIIDGNYSRTVEVRLKNCDTVFLFDLPTEVCMSGAVERLGKVRCDMPWIDEELDPWLKKEIEDFPHKTLPDIYELIEKHKADKKIVVFRSRAEADDFLQGLGNSEI